MSEEKSQRPGRERIGRVFRHLKHPEFTIIETGKEVEPYSAPFRSMPDIERK